MTGHWLLRMIAQFGAAWIVGIVLTAAVIAILHICGFFEAQAEARRLRHD